MPDEELPVRERLRGDSVAEEGQTSVERLFLSKTSSQLLRHASAKAFDRETDWGRRVSTLHSDIRERLEFYPASIQFHHRHVGGLGDHCAQVAYLMTVQNVELELGFDSAMLVFLALVHDWNKFTRYHVSTSKDRFQPFTYQRKETVDPALRLGRVLERFEVPAWDTDISNALTMSEGGWSPFTKSNSYADMSPLAVLLHCADLTSAKVFGSLHPRQLTYTSQELNHLADIEDDVILDSESGYFQ